MGNATMDENKSKEQLEFENDCLRLRKDDPTLTFCSNCLTSSDSNNLYSSSTMQANLILLGQSLMGNSHVCHLVIDLLYFEERVANALATGIARSNVTTLYLCCKSEGPQLEGKIWRILFEGIRSLPNLKLVLYNVTVVELNVLRDCMPSLTLLRKLAVDGVKGCEYGLVLSQIVMRTSCLTDLHVDVKCLDAMGISLLAHGLRWNTSVTTLDFSGSRMGDTCVELFVELWQPSSCIRTISLYFNDIGLRGAQRLLRAVADHPAMQVVNLRQNRNIGFDGLIVIGEELLNQTNLTELDVSCCTTWFVHSDPSCKEAKAQDRVSQQAGRALLEAVKQNVRIKRLDVSNMHLLPLGVESEICFYANLNKMGRYLLSSDRYADYTLPSTAWCYFLAKCQSAEAHKESLIYFFLCAEPSLASQPGARKRRREHALGCVAVEN
jgi:hypothetical protein